MSKGGMLMNMIENNLRAMIAQYLRDNPQESNKTIAIKKGVRPETVSRHSHDKIDMSMQDIKDYAEILGCTTFDIIFKSQPMPIVGIASAETNDGWIKYTHALTPETAECLYLHGTHDVNLSACKFEFADDYQGPYKMLDGAFEVWDANPALEHRVSKDALMNLCLIRTVNEEMHRGILYPQPGSNKYSLVMNHSAEPDVMKDLELEWAAPILKYIMRPDLEGASIVKSSTNPYALERTTLMYEYMNERRKRKGLPLL
tara:strand:- start:13 stop:786 length:774 start_codon:yes stop_codon:yes gene_type:complete